MPLRLSLFLRIKRPICLSPESLRIVTNPLLALVRIVRLSPEVQVIQRAFYRLPGQAIVTQERVICLQDRTHGREMFFRIHLDQSRRRQACRYERRQDGIDRDALLSEWWSTGPGKTNDLEAQIVVLATPLPKLYR